MRGGLFGLGLVLTTPCTTLTRIPYLDSRERPVVTTRFPMWGAIVAIVLATAVCAWLGHMAYQGVRLAEQTGQRVTSFEALRGEILRFDEVLTMSA